MAKKSGIEVVPLGDGRFALMVNGLARFVAYDQRACVDRATALGLATPTARPAQDAALARVLSHV